MQAYPRLAHSGRAYSRVWEARHWSLQRVLDRLAEYAVVRRVDRCGKVWLYDRSYWVGKPWVGQELYVTLDPQTREWLLQDPTGQVIRRQPARELTHAAVIALRIGRSSSHRPNSGKTLGRNQRQNYVSHLAAKLTVG